MTLKNAATPEAFLTSARAKLAERGIEAEVSIPLAIAGRYAGQPRRRVIRVKSKIIVGYALVVSGLTSEASLLLQSEGLGGRTRMGCGFFLPVREDLQ